jgi:hypothetical protein
LALGWQTEQQPAVVRYQQRFQQTNKNELFYFIFSYSFSIGATFGQREH